MNGAAFKVNVSYPQPLHFYRIQGLVDQQAHQHFISARQVAIPFRPMQQGFQFFGHEQVLQLDVPASLVSQPDGCCRVVLPLAAIT